MSDLWLKVIPIVISVISLFLSILVARRNYRFTENLHQPELKIIYVFDQDYATSNKIGFAINNLGNNIFKIRKVAWGNDKTISIDCYKGMHSASKTKSGIETEVFKKDVLYLDLKMSNKGIKGGYIKFKYIDMNGKNKTVWSPRIELNTQGVSNDAKVLCHFFTKYKS